MNLYYDYGAHTKFSAVFVPNSPQLRNIGNYIADNIQGFFDKDAKEKNFGLRSQGETTIDRIADFRFSRRIYLYYPGPLSVEELADVSKIFKDKGFFLQIRGDDWAAGEWQNFKSGAAPLPPALFDIKDGEIIQVVPLKSPLVPPHQVQELQGTQGKT